MDIIVIGIKMVLPYDSCGSCRVVYLYCQEKCQLVRVVNPLTIT